MLIQLFQQDMCDLRNLQLKFVSCTISHFGLKSFLDSIEHGFTKVPRIETDSQMGT